MFFTASRSFTVRRYRIFKRRTGFVTR